MFAARTNQLPVLSGAFPSDPDAYSLLPPSTVSSFTKHPTPLKVFRRDASSSPPAQLFKDHEPNKPLPTNRWYQNLLVGIDGGLTDAHKTYTIPYIIDAMFSNIVPPSAKTKARGIRVHSPNVAPSGDKIVQLTYDAGAGVGLGVNTAPSSSFEPADIYNVKADPSPLQLIVEWKKIYKSWFTETYDRIFSHPNNDLLMQIPIIRGSPYQTVHFFEGAIPFFTSTNVPFTDPYTPTDFTVKLDDDEIDLNCVMTTNTSVVVPSRRGEKSEAQQQFTLLHSETTLRRPSSKYVSVHFAGSDATWIVFLSRPLDLSCRVVDPKDYVPPPPSTPGVPPPPPSINFELFSSSPLSTPATLRVALANNCTTGINVQFCERSKPRDKSDFIRVLKEHSAVMPGSDAAVQYTFPTLTKYDSDAEEVTVHFNWSPVTMAGDNFTSNAPLSIPKTELLTYALPHHVDNMEAMVGSSNGKTGHCTPTLHGPACLVMGGNWAMRESLSRASFYAPRPPRAEHVNILAESLRKDIKFRIPANYMKGAGDTYFSGKILAKLSRILLVAQELRDLAHEADSDNLHNMDKEHKHIVEACASAHLPSDKEMNEAISHLRSGVTIWLNGSAQAPFVYDEKWGGMVNCGCTYDDVTQSCSNNAPTDCPGLTDPGQNFGHGYYNDHHFHHGYHIYAAATVAKFDSDWGREYFEPVLSLIRDIANPSSKDKYFPQFRHKDWFLGSSWASGIGLINGGPYPNGRNQESSSESIAAYEAMVLYGNVMYEIWGGDKSVTQNNNKDAQTAASIRDMSRLLLATELRSADRYWHVRKKVNRIYPKEYTPLVVGMLWSMMAQFQTWFGADAFLAYGIQLMPLTPISEQRDEVKWANEMYPVFKESCDSSQVCQDQGWAVLLRGIQATIGDVDGAINEVLELKDDVYVSAGGNGQSRTNTIWYISTRPYVELKVDDSGDDVDENTTDDDEVWVENPCDDCSHEVCTGSLNKCSTLDAPFLCTEGSSIGGCSPVPWELGNFCNNCCMLKADC
ncbi:hypothetical protein TrLO_g11715 [Triparma laevis f. longispina]|uniref:glucan endo-1,3-beta-D-glucosidase n=1 Tax=Triparma laevis f. longispina TaxID=1714387 RepID=A0A9W6ZME2_9STRA|nr:hypothetical protein TrLO_g11715 [Triparma laevis f. longispina]